MNEQLTNWLIEQTKNITNWTSSELPSFVQEYLSWNFYNGIFNSSIIFIIFSFFVFLIVKSIKIYYEKDDSIAPVIFLLIVPIFVSSVFFVCEVKEVIQIKVAPKAYLIGKVLKVKE